MKNLGISSSLLLLALLAGLWARTNETVSGRLRYAATDPDAPAQDHPERGDVPGWA